MDFDFTGPHSNVDKNMKKLFIMHDVKQITLAQDICDTDYLRKCTGLQIPFHLNTYISCIKNNISPIHPTGYTELVSCCVINVIKIEILILSLAEIVIIDNILY